MAVDYKSPDYLEFAERMNEEWLEETKFLEEYLQSLCEEY